MQVLLFCLGIFVLLKHLLFLLAQLLRRHKRRHGFKLVLNLILDEAVKVGLGYFLGAYFGDDFGAGSGSRFEACPIHQFISQRREFPELLEAISDVGVDLRLQLFELGDDFAAIEIFYRLVVKICLFQQRADVKECFGAFCICQLVRRQIILPEVCRSGI